MRQNRSDTSLLWPADWWAAILSLGLIVAACGGSDSETPRTAGSTTAPSGVTTVTTVPPDATTIMAVGDSITQGSTSWRTYRCALDSKLNDANVAFDFVGGLSSPDGGGSYGCPSAFDQDHEGRWGQRVDQVADAVTSSVQLRQPDVALIHLGTNDILQGQGAAGTASELQSLITGLQSASPDITILVAQIIPCDPVGGRGSGFGTKCTSDLRALNDLIGSFGSLRDSFSSWHGRNRAESRRFAVCSGRRPRATSPAATFALTTPKLKYGVRDAAR